MTGAQNRPAAASRKTAVGLRLVGLRLMVAATAGLLVLAAGIAVAPPAGAVPADYPYTVGFATDKIASCLARLQQGTNVVRRTGEQTTKLAPKNYSANLVYDLKGAHWKVAPDFQYPVNLENAPAVSNVCTIGGLFQGTVSRELTHSEVYLKPPKGLGYSGAVVRVSGDNKIAAGNWTVFDGQHVSDGSDPYRMIDNGFVLANAYSNFARDDCIENDNIAAGVVYDSLFQDCFTGLSERPAGSNVTPLSTFDTGQTVIADSLLGLGFQPYGVSITGAQPHPGSIVDGKGVANLFKWSSEANQLVLDNDVLLVPWLSVHGPSPMGFPDGTIAHHVTLVWLGRGFYPGKLVPGIRVTTDIGVWNRARSSWLERHGCDPTGEHCTRQDNPSAPPPPPPPPPQHAHAIDYVGRVGTGSTTVSTSTITVPVGRPVARGDSLFVSVASSRPTPEVEVAAVTDSGGDPYTIVRQTSKPSVHVALASAIGVHGLAAGDTVKVSFAAPVNRASVTVDAFSGVAGLDQTAVGAGTSTAAASGPATTYASGDLLFAVVGAGDTTITPGAGYTALPANDAGGRAVGPEFRIVPPGGYTASATLGRSVDWGVVLGTYVPPLGTGPPAAISYVGRVGVATVTASSSTITVPITTPVTAGASLFVAISTNRPTAEVAVTGVSDTKGDAYVVAGQGKGGGSAQYVALASANQVAALGTADRITVTLAAPVGSAGVTVEEFSGVSALEQAARGSGSSAAVASGAVESTSGHALLFAAIGTGSSDLSLTPGEGFTALPPSNLGGGRAVIPEFRVVSAAGSYAATGTLSSARDWGVVLGGYA